MIACLLLQASLARAEKVEQLKAQGYVDDFAGVLSEQTRQQLTALCTEIDQKTHAQIAVVTIQTLEGLEAPDFANRLFQQWGVGHKDDNRGVLILLAVDDHKYWVEVGYGLEPILPDGKVGGFGREMVPRLRAGDYNGGVLHLTSEIADVIAQDRGITLSSRPPSETSDQRQSESGPSPFSGIFGTALILLFILLVVVTRGRILWWLLFSSFLGSRGGGGWGGGGFGGGGGGGGFGGFGGGASGGGGAGGSW